MSKLSQVRTLYGDFARAYKYTFKIIESGSALKNLTPKPSTDQISSACLNVVLPAVGATEIAVEVGTHTMRLNGRHETSGTISPEFILSGDYIIYKYFRGWAGLAASHSDDTQELNSSLLATIHITAFNVKDETKKRVELQNVWCRNCPEVNFSDDSNDIIRFAPELVYEFAPDKD